MLRWLLIWSRNRLLAVSALAAIVAVCALLVGGAMRLVEGTPGILLAGLLCAVFVWWVADHPFPNRVARRLAEKEQRADPRPRL